MVVEERRCRGSAMSDAVAMPTRHHGQPNHQLSLASTLSPPPYRGMPITQPQSTCAHSRPPHAWELPTCEKGTIGSGRRPTRASLPLKREAEPTAVRWPTTARPASLGRKPSAARRPAEAGLPLKGEAEPTTARRPTTTRPASPGKGQAFCGPKAGRGKPACPRAQRQGNCGPKASNGKPTEAPHWKGASQLRWQAHTPSSALVDAAHSCVCVCVVGGGVDRSCVNAAMRLCDHSYYTCYTNDKS